MLKIGIVTDEISADLREAFALGTKWGVRDFELRCMGFLRVPEIAPPDLALIREYREGEGVAITALSPGVFKGPVQDEERTRREQNAVLPACFELAKELECSRVIVFGFKRPETDAAGNFDRAVQALSSASRRAGDRGITILLENEPGCWCDSGSNTAKVLEAVDASNLRANWDPANAVGLGEITYPDGYRKIEPFLGNLHIKDTPGDPMKECVPVGDGVVDWEGQLGAVVGDGRIDHVIIETHCLPLVENSRKNLDRIREILARVSGKEK